MATNNLYSQPTVKPVNQQLNNNRLLLLLFLVAEAMLFGCLIYANFMVRSAQGQWPPPGVNRMDVTGPLLFTVALLVSSLTTWRAVSALKSGNRNGFVMFLSVTVLLGAGFVFGMLRLLSSLQFTGPYSAMFAAMWVVHVTHAIVVLLFLGYVLWRATRGKYSAEAYWPVEAATNLWHFLDVVWVVLFVVLYLA